MRELLVACARGAGMAVEAVEDGDQLKRWLEDHHRPPRVVVSDVNMPGCSGLEVLRWLRDRLPSTHVILITAFGDARTHWRARQLGAVAVLNKPFEMSTLLALIGRLQEHEHASA